REAPFTSRRTHPAGCSTRRDRSIEMNASKPTKKTPAKPRTKKTTTAASVETATKAAPIGAKPAQPKGEAKPAEELVVFAIRLTEPERQAIHEAAGPARATRFIRAVAIAAAHGDVEAFKRALKEAEEVRAKAAKK